jgi:hypothetical protein
MDVVLIRVAIRLKGHCSVARNERDEGNIRERTLAGFSTRNLEIAVNYF